MKLKTNQMSRWGILMKNYLTVFFRKRWHLAVKNYKSARNCSVKLRGAATKDGR